MKNRHISFKFVLLAMLILSESAILSNACDESFEGFGIYLGATKHFAASPSGMIPKVFDKIYNDLGIRHFRTSYESTFSPKKDIYEIVCGTDSAICSWIDIHKEISQYQNTSIIASIWSPPSYMKHSLLNTLRTYQEISFYYFIKNVTELIKNQFHIPIERVSPVNEPENIFAPWEHTNMLPVQLCTMVKNFDDPLVSICPENSYLSTSSIYFKTSPCSEACKTFATHAYTLNLNFGGPNNLRGYYDLVAQDRPVPNNLPIWQTEVSSTYDNAADNQMQECLDLATNIANFVGHTCVQRYYFWLSYTLDPSGESLIWGNKNGDLTYPKKYYGYKHFTRAAHGDAKVVNKRDPLSGVTYLTFGDSKVVFINYLPSTVAADWTDAVSCMIGTFCCTTDLHDWNCSTTDELQASANHTILPAESVCSCDY